MSGEIFSSASYGSVAYAVPPLMTAVAILLLGLLVLLHEKASRVSATFFSVTLTIFIWLACFGLMYASESAESARRWAVLAYLGVPFIPTAFYHFSITVLRGEQARDRLVPVAWGVSGLFALAAVAGDALIAGLYRYWWGFYPKYGWLGAPFLLFFALLMGASLRNYWTEFRSAQGAVRRPRVRLFMIAFIFAFLGCVDFAPKYGLALYPFGYLPVLGFTAVMALAIWRYRLVDITPAFAAEQILSTMADALLVLDQEGLARVANHQASRLFGLPEDTLIGKPVPALGNGLLDKEGLEGLFRSGTLQKFETAYRPAEGPATDLEVSISAIRDQDGRAVAFVCLARDITARKRAEGELRESEERFRQLAETIRQVIWMTTPDKNRMIYISPAYEEIWGRSRESLYASPRSWLEAIHPADRDRVLEAALTKQAAGAYDEEYRIVRPDGTIRWIQDRAFPIRDRHGTIYRIAGIAEDISDRKRAEEAIRTAHDELERRVRERTVELSQAVTLLQWEIAERKRTEEQLQQSQVQLAEAQRLAHLGSWSWEMTTNTITWSDELYRIFGLTPFEFDATYEAYLACIHPEDREAVHATIQRAVRDHEAFDFHHRIVRADGTIRMLHCLGKVVVDQEGRPVRMVGSAQDVTDLKGVEEALRESEERYRTVAETAAEGIITIDQQGTIVFVNRATEQIFGYSAEEMLGRPLTMLMPESMRDAHRRSMAQYLGEGQKHRSWDVVHLPGRHKTGREIPLEFSFWEFSQHGTRYFSSIVRDTTERVQAAEVRSRLLEQVISAQEEERRRIARELHDETGQSLMSLLVGLHAIEAAGSAREAHTLARKYREIAALALEEVRRMAMGLRPSVLDDLGLAAAVERYAEQYAKSYGISVDVHCQGLEDHRLPSSVETAVYRIIQEALTNIAKHAQATVASIVIEPQPAFLQTIVEDNGCGFDVQQTLHSSGRTAHFGLHGMRERAGLINGTIEIESTVGRGTTIYVQVPLAEQSSGAAASWSSHRG
jgi:PAS domain S-box-containing protein